MEPDSLAISAGIPHFLLQFSYDYLGRRVQKRVVNVSLGNLEMTSRRFLYDGWNLVAEYQAPGGTTIGSIVRSYAWGLDIARSLTDAGGVGALVQVTDHGSGKTYLPTYDGNGNIASIVNAESGIIAATYEYDANGQLLRADDTDSTIADQPFRFSTKFTDVETKLIYYGHRYYSPELGRFINRDPSEESGGLNLYGFCGNDGINRWDYLGLDPTIGDLVPGYDKRYYYFGSANSDWTRLTGQSDGIYEYTDLITKVTTDYVDGGTPVDISSIDYGDLLFGMGPPVFETANYGGPVGSAFGSGLATAQAVVDNSVIMNLVQGFDDDLPDVITTSGPIVIVPDPTSKSNSGGTSTGSVNSSATSGPTTAATAPNDGSVAAGKVAPNSAGALQFTGSVTVQSSSGPITFSSADLNYASATIYAEAKNNPDDQYAVASVLWNRIGATGISGGVANTFTDVSNAPNQFTGVGSAKFSQAMSATPGSTDEYNSAVNQLTQLLGDGSAPGASYLYNQFLSYPKTGYQQVVPGGNYYYNNPGIKGPNE
jgi:RHS repeat-associated protein